jgi:hypothetical protein
MKNLIVILFLVALIIWLLTLTSCRSCPPAKQITNGRAAQKHDRKKMKAQIRVMWAKQFGKMCEVRYENKKEMLNVIYQDCDCKKVPVGTWVDRDSI